MVTATILGRGSIVGIHKESFPAGGQSLVYVKDKSSRGSHAKYGLGFCEKAAEAEALLQADGICSQREIGLVKSAIIGSNDIGLMRLLVRVGEGCPTFPKVVVNGSLDMESLSSLRSGRRGGRLSSQGNSTEHDCA